MYIDLMKMCLSLRCQGNTDVLDFKWRSVYLKKVVVKRMYFKKEQSTHHLFPNTNKWHMATVQRQLNLGNNQQLSINLTHLKGSTISWKKLDWDLKVDASGAGFYNSLALGTWNIYWASHEPFNSLSLSFIISKM